MSDNRNDTYAGDAPGIHAVSPLGRPYRRIHRTEFDPDGAEDLNAVIVRSIAAVKGVAPTELDERLYESIDPDALDLLFSSGGRGRHRPDRLRQLTFELCGLEIRVHSGGEITVYEVLTPRHGH